MPIIKPRKSIFKVYKMLINSKIKRKNFEAKKNIKRFYMSKLGA